MHSTLIRFLLALAAFALPLVPAHAITCYLVYDRNDNAIFQDTYPPIDLSERGQAERDAMYKRGEQLIVMESERCPTIEFLTGAGGSKTLSVDQVVAGMRTGPIAPGSSGGGRVSSTGAAPAKAPAPTRATPTY
jgi:hypothetical protein